jgi:hypothetical protein
MADFTLTVPDAVIGVDTQPPVDNGQTADASSVVAEPPAVDKPVVEVAPAAMAEVAAEPQPPIATAEPSIKTINVGHGSFNIDSRATPEAIAAARDDYINTNIDFYAGIDRTTGASWGVTKAVADAIKPEDKLATIRGFHPDAMPFGEDNFIFTNPDTGKVTLYNVPGFTVKDVARFAREGSIAVGSTLAGVATGVSALVTGPAAPVSVPIAATAGAVWGGAATASVYDFLSEKLGGTVRSESLMARTGENLMQGLYAGGGEAVGRVAVPAAIGVVKQGLGGGTAKAQQIYETLIANNIRPTAGAVTEGRGVGVIEKALDQAAASATRMRNQINEVIDGAQAAAERLASKIGTPRSQQGAGQAMQDAAQSALERFSAQQSKLETELGEKIGEDTLFSIDSIRGFYNELASMGQSMPRFTKRAFGDVKEILDDLIFDAAANGGRIPYRDFRRVRSVFGERMADMNEGAKRSMWKRMYAHMTDDLKFGADSLGHGKMFDDAVGFTRGFKQEYDDFLNKIIDYDAPEAGYRFLIRSRQDGGTYFAKLQEQFTKEEWKDVSATIIQKMGYKNFGNEADEAFSVATFLTNWQSISKEAKATLFLGIRNGPTLQKNLDGLVEGFEAIAANARLAGHSNTGAVTHTLNLMNALGGNFTKVVLGATALSGNLPTAIGGLGAAFVGGVVTPNVSARLITSPVFVKWLAEGAAVKTGKQSGEHIGRLLAISQANPEIAADIDEYILAIKDGIMPANEGTAQ